MTLLPQYRAQLYAAATHRARRRPATLTRLWPVAVSTAVVIVVAVAAVAMLSYHHRPSSAPTLTRPAEPLTGHARCAAPAPNPGRSPDLGARVLRDLRITGVPRGQHGAAVHAEARPATDPAGGRAPACPRFAPED